MQDYVANKIANSILRFTTSDTRKLSTSTESIKLSDALHQNRDSYFCCINYSHTVNMRLDP